MTTPRNRSLKFEDHRGLIIKNARRYHARLLGGCVMGVDFDDVFGELSHAFVKAAKGYNTESEFTFTAFLGTCLQNHFNKYAKRLMIEQYGVESPTEGEFSGGIGYISIEDMGLDDDSDGYQGFETFADEAGATPEDICSARMELDAVLNDGSLSAETRVYVSLLANPALELSERVKERIRRASPKIRAELHNRYDIKMQYIRV